MAGKKIKTLADYTKKNKLSHANLINKANRQTIEAFLEKKRIKNQEVQEKAEAGKKFCESATEFNLKNRGKKWKYFLIPHNAIGLNMGFGNLVENYVVLSNTNPREKLIEKAKKEEIIYWQYEIKQTNRKRKAGDN